MFKPVNNPTEWVDIVLNGEPTSVPANVNLAAAILMRATHCRTTVVFNANRGPFCMMGVCFDCLVEINGVANQQACMRSVEPGMRVIFQQGAVSLGESIDA